MNTAFLKQVNDVINSDIFLENTHMWVCIGSIHGQTLSRITSIIIIITRGAGTQLAAGGEERFDSSIWKKIQVCIYYNGFTHHSPEKLKYSLKMRELHSIPSCTPNSANVPYLMPIVLSRKVVIPSSPFWEKVDDSKCCKECSGHFSPPSAEGACAVER